MLSLAAPTLLAEVAHGYVVKAVGPTPPTDVDWDAWIAFSRKVAKGCKGMLIDAEAGPNSTQRAKLMEAGEIRKIKTAIISPLAAVRGIGTAVAWLGKTVQTYSPAQMTDALDFLEVSEGERPVLLDKLGELRRRLGK